MSKIKFSDLVSPNAIAFYAFLCILFAFFIHKRICHFPDLDDDPALLNIKRDYDITIDPSELGEDKGILHAICSYKSSFMTNLGIAFLLLTVIR